MLRRMVKQERQKQLREEYEAKITPRDTHGGHLKSYTSGLFSESNSGYSDLLSQWKSTMKAHSTKFTVSNREGPSLKIAPSRLEIKHGQDTRFITVVQK